MKLFRLAVIIFMLPAMLVPLHAVEYDAKSYILMEASTGQILLEENADEPLPPASVTKIMTMLLVMDAIESGRIGWDDQVTTSEYAASMGGSQVFLEPGESMTVGEMLKCVVVASANDAAVALAEAIAGSEEAFVAQMNERAAGLGMKNTLFKNTNGLDDDVEGHVTSARDIAIMSRELIVKYPKILEYSSIWMDSIRGGEFGLTNTNRLVRFYRGANGLKTGSTSKAKFCISATAERDGMTLIAVIMAAPSGDTRSEIAKKLLDYGFAGWEITKAELDEPLGALTVTGGTAESVPLSVSECDLLLERGKGARITREVYLPEKISAPVEAGQELGRVDFMIDGEKIASLPITAAEEVKRLGYMGVLREFMTRMLLIGM